MGWSGVAGRSRREGICVYIQLFHFIVQQKLTWHCKAIILQLKNKYECKFQFLEVALFVTQAGLSHSPPQATPLVQSSSWLYYNCLFYLFFAKLCEGGDRICFSHCYGPGSQHRSWPRIGIQQISNEGNELRKVKWPVGSKLIPPYPQPPLSVMELSEAT